MGWYLRTQSALHRVRQLAFKLDSLQEGDDLLLGDNVVALAVRVEETDRADAGKRTL